MSAEPSLDRLQRWFQAVVVHPGAIADALQAPSAASEIEPGRLGDVIVPSPTLSSAERVAIYHEMYPLRMGEALANDYPALQHFLGDDNFTRLVAEYVAVHPSRTYTLNRLGDHLPQFIKDHAEIPRRDFCYDLARLELAVTEAFDAEEVEALGPEAIAAVSPGRWDGARFTPIPALRLLAFRYPVNAYAETVRADNHDHPKARLKNTWVAVYRRNYAVYRLDLTRPAFDLLTDLANGSPLRAAIERALKGPARRRPSEDELFRWFRDWVAGGLFRSVAIDR